MAKGKERNERSVKNLTEMKYQNKGASRKERAALSFWSTENRKIQTVAKGQGKLSETKFLISQHDLIIPFSLLLQT